MSYLNTPRLTFSGKFQADPSTVNNDPNHFNNTTFQPNFQDYGKGATNGWWNPDGTGNFRLIDCVVTSVTYQDGSMTSDPNMDPIIGMSVMDADGRVAGKIVDLDSQQQMVSEIWGMQVRIVNKGQDLMKGVYKEAPFTNIWMNRSVDYKRNPDRTAAASYQSILKNIDWNIEETNSRYLEELNGMSQDQLSIQFIVDRFNNDNSSADFTIGRLAGSIGPSSVNEPSHCVLGRQLFPEPNSNCNYATAIVDDHLKNIVLDFSNALQFGKKDDKVVVVETRNLTLAVNKGTSVYPEYIFLGKINYDAPGWYLKTSGICTFSLSDENLELVHKYPLAIVDYQASQQNTFTLIPNVNEVFQESVEYVIADNFVHRLNPNDTSTIDFYATNLGKPLSNKSVCIQFDTANILQGQEQPVLGVPQKALKFTDSIQTNAYGKATLNITAGDPGNPRQFIDGQVYALSYSLKGQSFSSGNQNNFISILVFDKVKETNITNPNWDTDILPIMQQYANLYPLMSKGVFNLANKEVVDGQAVILKMVFSKEKTDPNFMPVTRDLSRDKQQMIINYLNNFIPKEEEEIVVKIEEVVEVNIKDGTEIEIKIDEEVKINMNRFSNKN